MFDGNINRTLMSGSCSSLCLPVRVILGYLFGFEILVLSRQAFFPRVVFPPQYVTAVSNCLPLLLYLRCVFPSSSAGSSCHLPVSVPAIYSLRVS